ncbi:MAG: response regulator [Parvularculaceae bacterium]|nr:response regulator [Parvularculaceae bacterium]
MAHGLIVDDSSRVRQIIAALLQEIGIDAVEASSPVEALQRLDEATPDLILLDWDLPKLGALDVLTGTVDIALPRPTTLLMAAERDPKNFALAKAAGASSFLLKPFDRHSFFDALRTAGVEVIPGAA